MNLDLNCFTHTHTHNMCVHTHTHIIYIYKTKHIIPSSQRMLMYPVYGPLYKMLTIILFKRKIRLGF